MYFPPRNLLSIQFFQICLLIIFHNSTRDQNHIKFACFAETSSHSQHSGILGIIFVLLWGTFWCQCLGCVLGVFVFAYLTAETRNNLPCPTLSKDASFLNISNLRKRLSVLWVHHISRNKDILYRAIFQTKNPILRCINCKKLKHNSV